MANQGLFTSGPSVDDLLQQRNKRSSDLQQQLMNQAAQGARDPAKARAVSFLGSSLGRALGGSLGGGSTRDTLEAKEAQKNQAQQSVLQARQGTSAGMFEVAKKLASTYPSAADQLNALGLQKLEQEKKEEAALKIKQQEKLEEDLATQVAIEDKAAMEEATMANNKQMSQMLAISNPDLSKMLLNDVVPSQVVTAGLQAMAVNRKAKAASLGANPDNVQLTNVGVFKAPDGDLYSVSKAVTKGKKDTETLYTPIGGAPAYDGQKLAPTNSAGLTQGEQVAMAQSVAQATEQGKSWVAIRDTARENIPIVNTSLSQVDRMLEILPQINTGGWSATVAKDVTDALGITPTNLGEFQNLSATAALSQLKATFGGAGISDSERQILMDLQASIKNGAGLNLAILTRAKDALLYRKTLYNGALETNDPSVYDQLIMSTEMPRSRPPAAAPVSSVTPRPTVTSWGEIPDNEQ